MGSLAVISSAKGSQLMRDWGVSDWVDPGAEYAVYENCCVFALVQQDGFFDIHMAMDMAHRRACRAAGRAILDVVGSHRLRAVILGDRPHVCNYAARMGFSERTEETVKLIDGSNAPVFIMWRKPEVKDGRSN